MSAPHSKYFKFRNRILDSLSRYPLFALLSHWMFQGLFYMDFTERLFKIVLDILGTLLLIIIFHHFLSVAVAIVVSFLIAHTLNFLFNGQMWGVLKFFSMVRISRDRFSRYIDGMITRMKREPALEAAYVYGSIARGEWSEMSDFDLRLVRLPGFLNGLRSCWFLLLERSRALFAGFPLDAYVLDGYGSLAKLRNDETKLDLLSHPNASSLSKDPELL